MFINKIKEIRSYLEKKLEVQVMRSVYDIIFINVIFP